MTDFPSLLYASTCDIPTLLYAWSLKKVPLSGGAYPYRLLEEVAPRALHIFPLVSLEIL